MEDPLETIAASETLLTRFREAATLIDGTNGLIRVISHYDGDGICSAGIVSRALFRSDKRFHTSMLSVVSRDDLPTLGVDYSLMIVLDMGSAIAPDISDHVLKLGARCIILDHHLPDGRQAPYSISDGRGILEINPRFHGVNGSTGCCGSTLAFLLALAMGDANLDLGVFALAGAMADRQNVPELSELNGNIRTYLSGKDVVRPVRGLPMQGRTISESLILSNDPFLSDLSGNPKKVNALLGSMGIDPESRLQDLDRDRARLLQSYLYVHMLSTGTDPHAVHELFRETCTSDAWGDLQTLGFEIDACGRIGETATGLEVIWGDPKARERAFEVRRSYRLRVQENVRKLREAGPRKLGSIDVIEVEEETMAGILAGIAHNYLLDHSRPVLSLSGSGGEIVKVSSRGNRSLCRRGLNLGKVMNDASREFGGTGGGHDVAAGASVPAGRIEEFLARADSMVGEQIGRKL